MPTVPSWLQHPCELTVVEAHVEDALVERAHHGPLVPVMRVEPRRQPQQAEDTVHRRRRVEPAEGHLGCEQDARTQSPPGRVGLDELREVLVLRDDDLGTPAGDGLEGHGDDGVGQATLRDIHRARAVDDLGEERACESRLETRRVAAEVNARSLRIPGDGGACLRQELVDVDGERLRLSGAAGELAQAAEGLGRLF